MTPPRRHIRLHVLAALFLPVISAHADFRAVPDTATPTPAPETTPAITPPPESGAAPTPFQGAGTLAATPTPPPATPTPPPVQYESPRVQLLGKINVWDKNKFPAGATAGYLPSYTVEGTIQAFHPPAGGYFVECIFVGKREGTLKPVVCNVSGTVVRGDYPPIMLDIPPPSSAGYYALPGMKYKFTDPNTKNESNTPAAVDDVTKVTFDDPRAGLPGGGMPVNIKFPIVGWMVRILAGGQASTTPGPYGRPRSMTYTGGEVVYTGGSDDTLATLVRDNPAYFQKLYEIYSAPPPAAQPGMDGYPGQRRPGMPPQ